MLAPQSIYNAHLQTQQHVLVRIRITLWATRSLMLEGRP